MVWFHQTSRPVGVTLSSYRHSELKGTLCVRTWDLPDGDSRTHLVPVFRPLDTLSSDRLTQPLSSEIGNKDAQTESWTSRSSTSGVTGLSHSWRRLGSYSSCSTWRTRSPTAVSTSCCSSSNPPRLWGEVCGRWRTDQGRREDRSPWRW